MKEWSTICWEGARLGTPFDYGREQQAGFRDGAAPLNLMTSYRRRMRKSSHRPSHSRTIHLPGSNQSDSLVAVGLPIQSARVAAWTERPRDAVGLWGSRCTVRVTGVPAHCFSNLFVSQQVRWVPSRQNFGQKATLFSRLILAFASASHVQSRDLMYFPLIPTER